jgi:hypothetical protein
MNKKDATTALGTLNGSHLGSIKFT